MPLVLFLKEGMTDLMMVIFTISFSIFFEYSKYLKKERIIWCTFHTKRSIDGYKSLFVDSKSANFIPFVEMI